MLKSGKIYTVEHSKRGRTEMLCYYLSLPIVILLDEDGTLLQQPAAAGCDCRCRVHSRRSEGFTTRCSGMVQQHSAAFFLDEQ